MNLFFAQHLAALRLALRRLTGSPLTSLLSIIAIGLALALPAGGHVLLGGIGQFAQGAAPGPQISVFMRIDATQDAVGAAETALRAHAGIGAVRFLPREETLRRMKDSARLKDAIEVLGRNPFPDAFALTPRDESPTAMEALAEDLRRMPAVEHVQLDSDWARRLDALIALGGKLLTVLAALLGIGVAAITFNIIRLQQLTLRAEIEVSRLLGATEGFIRRPFVYFGAVLGLIGGFVALLLVSLLSLWLAEPVASLASLYGLGGGDIGLSLSDAAWLHLLAAGLGAAGAMLSPATHGGQGGQ